MRPIKNIIVPLNFSASANSVIETGIAMCKQHDAVLHLLQVNPEASLPNLAGKNALLMDLRLQARRDDLDTMELKAKTISETNQITCFYHISEGPFAQTVAAVANDFYCDLILLERPGTSPLSIFLKSNNAYEIVGLSNCPVLMIPDRWAKKSFNSVLFPVWPANSILDKLDVSLPIIRENKSRVTLFGSTTTRNKLSESVMVDNLIRSAYSIIKMTNKNVEREMDPTPRTARKIIRKAIEKRSDLVVISASVKRGLKHFFRRDYTEIMLNDCPVPVLSVK